MTPERTEGPWTDAGPVEAQIKELEHTVEHLVRSNAEMEEFLATEPDKEIRKAIGENIVTISRRRAIIEDLRKLMPMGGPSNVAVAVAVALPAAEQRAADVDMVMGEDAGDTAAGVHL